MDRERWRHHDFLSKGQTQQSTSGSLSALAFMLGGLGFAV